MGSAMRRRRGRERGRGSEGGNSLSNTPTVRMHFELCVVQPIQCLHCSHMMLLCILQYSHKPLKISTKHVKFCKLAFVYENCIIVAHSIIASIN